MQLKTYLIYCLILYLVLVIRTLLYIEKEKKQEEQIKRTDETERERTMAKDAADLSPVPRLSFCSV